MYQCNNDESFDRVFPMGLPLGVTKPNITVSYHRGSQRVAWQENESLAVLQGDIYPNFCVYDFAIWLQTGTKLQKFSSPEELIKPLSGNKAYKHSSWTVAINLCQTDTEKDFLRDYIRRYVCVYEAIASSKRWNSRLNELKDKVPALIPQVWIKWDSQSVKHLNRMGYQSESPYRIDFGVFWNNKFYIILLDGIQHYAKQKNGRWDADEEAYAARLREDRLLRMQGWEVFRIGNWETKDDLRRAQVFEEMREFIDFPNPSVEIEKKKHEDVPF